ncbi:MAG: NAD(P)H-dependent oxidoreductase subunit E [Chloroflexi bacterium]|nr:NAD(P)H-dependent oxidoreductase subunit E [Chloroflexota bacterium]
MTSKSKPSEHPSGDERYKSIDRTMKRAGYQKDALLEVLNVAQETFGFLSEDLMVYISRHVNVPLSQTYGVATFYHMFTFEPLGENNCIICTGTACHVKGANKIAGLVAESFDVEEGGTTSDRLFSLTTARCLGSCGLAPVIVINGTVSGKETPDSTVRRVADMLNGARSELAVVEAT